MRLIDADELRTAFPAGEYIRTESVRATIDHTPTIEERKTGKWIPHKEISREYIGTVLISVIYDYWFCDACGYRVENGQPTYKFCPDCGVKMEADNGTNKG